MARFVVGVIGPGAEATAREVAVAHDLGMAIARQGWVLLTGGRHQGVMHAACQGAKAAGGLTLGILPTDNPSDLSPAVDIAIFTGMGQARNAINVLSSAVVIACGLGPGTLSEIALAIKAHKPVLLLGIAPAAAAFLPTLGTPNQIMLVSSAEDAITQVRNVLSQLPEA